jgi:hypothetical protein
VWSAEQKGRVWIAESRRKKHRPRALAAVACSVALALGSISADDAEGAFEVRSCANSTESVNRSWHEARTSPTAFLTSFSACSPSAPDPYGDMRRGIGVLDNAETGDVPADGRFAEQRFTAPSGTQISAASVVRDLGNRDIYWSNFGRVDGVDITGETCVKPPLAAYCRIVGTRSFTSLNARSLAYGLRCSTPYASCTNGWSLHHVWAIVRSATVTLEDTEAPAVSAPRGDLADGRWRRGAGSLTFSAVDNTGVRIRRLIEGGRVRASRVAPGAPVGCGDHNVGDAYTYLQPCAGGRGLNGEQVVQVANVCVWGDGVHDIKGVAVDTGGGDAVSDAAATVKVDCTAPVVSVGPDAASEVDAGETVAPAVSAVDAHAGVTATEVEVDAGDGVWRPYEAPLRAAVGSAYRFRARATDAAGNVSPWSEPSAPIFVRASDARRRSAAAPRHACHGAPSGLDDPGAGRRRATPLPRRSTVGPADRPDRRAVGTEPPDDIAPTAAAQAHDRSPAAGRAQAEDRRDRDPGRAAVDRPLHHPRRRGTTQGLKRSPTFSGRFTLTLRCPAAQAADPRARAAPDARRTGRHGGEDRSLTSGDARIARSPLPPPA